MIHGSSRSERGCGSDRVGGHYLDLAGWPRREHFEFYRDFEMPFWGLTTEVEVGPLVRRCADDGGSFFLRLLWCAQAAINQVEPLRMRRRGDRVWVHDVVHPGTTVLRSDETFGFVDLTYDADPERFEQIGRRALDRGKVPGPLTPNVGRDDMVFYTSIPWVKLTAFHHARRVPAGEDSIPRVVFGRREDRPTGAVIAVAIDVDHALVDGLHVGRWLEAFVGAVEGWGGGQGLGG